MLFLAVTMSNMLIFIFKWQIKNVENYYFLQIIYTKHIFFENKFVQKAFCPHKDVF